MEAQQLNLDQVETPARRSVWPKSMATVIVALSMSLDGFVADPADQVGPLLDWSANGQVEIPTIQPPLTLANLTYACLRVQQPDRKTSGWQGPPPTSAQHDATTAAKR